ncbi:FAD-dependent oxidoreductase [Bradyrhizobium guangdongense]|uniref:FAD-dependent oxidoreductase n=4 Tax=Bradyrhizobium TaxID=374 RepID=A0AA88BA90_9BRAD|nr:FAD-dependent oxidoreductase [Bradyrhizobium guangdongense]
MDTEMSLEVVDTIVIGAGQAGLAMSEHLTSAGIPHVVLERHRIAERWRTARWDSLVANGPAWHDRFPGLTFQTHPDAFPGKEEIADYFVAYAKKIAAPVRCGVEVTAVQRNEGRLGFRVETSQGTLEANNVVAAIGPFQIPTIPQVVPQDIGVVQIHSSDYRNPEQLPRGAVLVVGAGSSGSQIADELLRSDRKVYLSVGPHERPPRSYRGYDFCWWLGVLGKWDNEARVRGTEHVTISVSGARGGYTVDFRKLAADGMMLVGSTEAFEAGNVTFASDLAKNVAMGDASLFTLLDEADEYVRRNGLALPEEPEARRLLPDPDCLMNPQRELNLKTAGVNTIIWATGFSSDYSWLKVKAFDEAGKPEHQRGVSSEPGVYFVGLPWQSRRGSAFIWGVWHDAKYIADRISTRRRYLEHHVVKSEKVDPRKATGGP